MSIQTKLSGDLSLNGKILSQYIGSWLAYKWSQLFSSNRQVFLLFRLTHDCGMLFDMTWIYLHIVFGLLLGRAFKHAFFLPFTSVFWRLKQTRKPRVCTLSLQQHGHFKVKACSSLWRANCFGKPFCLFTNCSRCSSQEIRESLGCWMWEDKPADKGTAAGGLFAGPEPRNTAWALYALCGWGQNAGINTFFARG